MYLEIARNVLICIRKLAISKMQKEQKMEPTRREKTPQHDLFRSRLDQIINLRHELVKLSGAIDWNHIEAQNAKFYSDEGRPGVNARLMVGLHILKEMYNLSDESVCERWVYDPYFQYFCGEEYFCHELKMERSSMTHWRKRVGERFCEVLVQESLMAAYKVGALKGKDLKRVVADTTVQPKAVTYPTDAKLCYKALLGLGKIAKEKGIKLRQNYVRVSKKYLIGYGRYKHANQMKRANKALRKLRTFLGRVIRDVERKIVGDKGLRVVLRDSLNKAKIILNQRRHEKEKLYSWHAPETECIGKGKAGKPYEFGCKVSITTNVNKAAAGHFVLHAEALHGRPYDGHTLNRVITEMESWTGISPERIYVDKGYRGHDYPLKNRVYQSGQKRGITATIKKELKRRSVVEPLIGHLKNEGRLGRNYLKGILGDKLNALLVAAGYNFKLILKWLRKIFNFIFILFYWIDDRKKLATIKHSDLIVAF